MFAPTRRLSRSSASRHEGRSWIGGALARRLSLSLELLPARRRRLRGAHPAAPRAAGAAGPRSSALRPKLARNGPLPLFGGVIGVEPKTKRLAQAHDFDAAPQVLP